MIAPGSIKKCRSAWFSYILMSGELFMAFDSNYVTIDIVRIRNNVLDKMHPESKTVFAVNYVHTPISIIKMIL